MKPTIKHSAFIAIGLIFSLFTSCQKELDNEINVTVITNDISLITAFSAVSGGKIINKEGLIILEQGVCWDTLPNPTVQSNKTSDSIINSVFKSALYGLHPYKDYYIRAYIKAGNGIKYGNEFKFKTYSVDSFLVDFDYHIDQQVVPVTLTVENKTLGANYYYWDFEGASPSNSTNNTPSSVLYSDAGSFTITLTACNGQFCKTTKKTIQLENPYIVFKDSALEQRVRIAMNKPTGKILIADAAKILSLNLRKITTDTAYIRNIEDLIYFPALKYLYLNNNLVTNIDVISNLKNLLNLDLYNNLVSDITPLSNLTELRVLCLWKNKVNEVSALSGLTNLIDLNIGANKITDIAPIKDNIAIISLWLNANYYFTDTSTIKNFVNLKTLGITACGISNINFVKDLTNLVDLLFENNKVSDITPLKNHTKLNSLFMGGNKIQNFSILETLYNNGCFRSKSGFGKNININSNETIVSSGTENRRVIDYLISNNVIIDWETGNTN